MLPVNVTLFYVFMFLFETQDSAVYKNQSKDA